MRSLTWKEVWSRLVQAVAGELEEVSVEGHAAWMLASEASGSWPEAQDVLRVLPHFDCYLIGCHLRDRLVPEAWARSKHDPTFEAHLCVRLSSGGCRMEGSVYESDPLLTVAS